MHVTMRPWLLLLDLIENLCYNTLLVRLKKKAANVLWGFQKYVFRPSRNVRTGDIYASDYSLAATMKRTINYERILNWWTFWAKIKNFSEKTCPFSVRFMSVLCPFYVRFVSVLCPFYVRFMSVLTKETASMAHLLNTPGKIRAF